MKRFLNDDKTKITLPVPLGATVYSYSLKCCDACLFQQEKFDETFPKAKYPERCGTLPCNTIFNGTYSTVFAFFNMETVLSQWGTRFFATEKEAEQQGLALTKRYRTQMESMGFEDIAIPSQTYVIFETPRCNYPMEIYDQLREQIVHEWLPSAAYQFTDGPEIVVTHWYSGEHKKDRYVEIWLPIEKKA